MKLFDGGKAPNPRRVRIFLAEKGIEVPTIQVDIGKAENRQPDYLAKNPMGYCGLGGTGVEVLVEVDSVHHRTGVRPWQRPPGGSPRRCRERFPAGMWSSTTWIVRFRRRPVRRVHVRRRRPG